MNLPFGGRGTSDLPLATDSLVSFRSTEVLSPVPLIQSIPKNTVHCL